MLLPHIRHHSLHGIVGGCAAFVRILDQANYMLEFRKLGSILVVRVCVYIGGRIGGDRDLK